MGEPTAGNELAVHFRTNGFAVVSDLADAPLLEEMRAVYDGMLDGSVPCPGTDAISAA